jgi:ADP-ribose pyrophosphatase YjhB (NUDIX family)
MIARVEERRRDYPDRPIVGVGVVVWRAERVLLIQRARPPRQGEWSLPGGGQLLGESVEQAARREVLEETGLTLDRLELLTVVDLVDRDDAGPVRYHYTLIDFVAEAADGEARPGDDARAAAWVLPEALDALGIWSETIRIIALARDRYASWAR